MRSLFLVVCLWIAPAFADDFHVPSDAEALSLLREALQGKPKHFEREVARLGNRTVEVQALVSLPGDIALMRKIAPDFAHWRDWLTKDINTPWSEEDSGYAIQFQDIIETEPGVLTMPYRVNLPFFSRQRVRAFRMTSSIKDPGVSILGEAILSENSPVKFTKGYMRVFPAENSKETLWILVKALVQFRGWFLYEALPEKLLLREMGDRIRRFMDNYAVEEALLRAGKRSPENPNPKTIPKDEE
jgi:hypothetical protein